MAAPAAGALVAVVGAGYVGVSTALQLAKAGFRVVVLERGAEAATEASHLNGGLLCPSLTWPWSNPSAVGLLAKSLRASLPGSSETPALRFSAASLAEGRLWRWGAHFGLHALSASKVAANFQASHRLAARGCSRRKSDRQCASFASERLIHCG